jgi:hypothetical protein
MLGMRVVNGNPITESAQGPELDTSQNVPVAPTQTQPWMQDPLGNAAGWTQITLLDLVQNQSYQLWAWTGPVIGTPLPIPWMTDPANVPAGWIVCTDNTFWGTGHCPTQNPGINFQKGTMSLSPDGSNPFTCASQPATPPIVPPTTVSPRFYVLTSFGKKTSPGVPGIFVGNLSGTSSVSSDWIYTITYDGNQVFQEHGTKTWVVDDPDSYIYLSGGGGWSFDPTGLAGYPHGSAMWTYQFEGAASTNTNPAIIQTLQFPSIGSGLLNPIFDNSWPPVFITG